MGAHHGDLYSVPSFGLQPPLEQSAHSMVIQAFTLGEHPSNANYERSKVISEGAKIAKVAATPLPPTILLCRNWYKSYIRGSLQRGCERGFMICT